MSSTQFVILATLVWVAFAAGALTGWWAISRYYGIVRGPLPPVRDAARVNGVTLGMELVFSAFLSDPASRFHDIHIARGLKRVRGWLCASCGAIRSTIETARSEAAVHCGLCGGRNSMYELRGPETPEGRAALMAAGRKVGRLGTGFQATVAEWLDEKPVPQNKVPL